MRLQSLQLPLFTLVLDRSSNYRPIPITCKHCMSWEDFRAEYSSLSLRVHDKKNSHLWTSTPQYRALQQLKDAECRLWYRRSWRYGYFSCGSSLGAERAEHLGDVENDHVPGRHKSLRLTILLNYAQSFSDRVPLLRTS